MKIILTAIVVWWMIGVSGFCFWWRTDYDVTTQQIPLAFVAGFLGPVSWLVGYVIHDDGKPTVLLKKTTRQSGQ